jgi:adenylate cyclase
MEALIAAGVDKDVLVSVASEGENSLAQMVARYVTFPGARKYTMPQVIEMAGVDEARAQALWRAMGFADVPSDQKAFTDADVETLKLATALFERAGLDQAVALQQARTMGQAAARVAFAHQDVIANFTTETDLVKRAGQAIKFADATLPALDKIFLYMYRRHLAAATEQQLLIMAAEEGTLKMSVGFADLSRYTSVSRELDADALAALIEGFNAAAADAIVESGGRLVKTIGDEVMFAALDAPQAASIALKLLDVVSPAEGYPALRVGVATGGVIAREGDLFGTTVNLANRLVVVARPGTILVDEVTRDALRGDARFDVKPVAQRHLRGLGRVRPYRLRSAAGARAV